MIFPALLDAGKDRELRTGRGASALAVYVYLLGELDFREYRRKKAYAIARVFKIKERTAGLALRTLVERGYLEAGPTQNHGNTRQPREYRLVWSRPHDRTSDSAHEHANTAAVHLVESSDDDASTASDADVPANDIAERRIA